MPTGFKPLIRDVKHSSGTKQTVSMAGDEISALLGEGSGTNIFVVGSASARISTKEPGVESALAWSAQAGARSAVESALAWSAQAGARRAVAASW